MQESGITDLRQITESDWQAVYQDENGTNTIKVSIDARNKRFFSCTCDSYHYPCKHVPIVEEALNRKIASSPNIKEYDKLLLEKLIKSVPVEELRDFIISQVKSNPELYNTAYQRFLSKNLEENNISDVVRKITELKKYLSFDALDQWLAKARDCVQSKKFREAFSVCKAVIGEYSKLLSKVGEDVTLVFTSDYITALFDIMDYISDFIDNGELYKYCLSELSKKKYTEADINFNNRFHQLLGKLALTSDGEAYLELQDKLIASAKNRNSGDVKNILERKLEFLRLTGQDGDAWELIEKNMHIESFCMEAVEHRIERNDLSGAKVLINEFIEIQSRDPNRFINTHWYKLLMDIYERESSLIPNREPKTGMYAKPRIRKRFKK